MALGLLFEIGALRKPENRAAALAAMANIGPTDLGR